jgi:hypothetical protein
LWKLTPLSDSSEIRGLLGLGISRFHEKSAFELHFQRRKAVPGKKYNRDSGFFVEYEKSSKETAAKDAEEMQDRSVK